MTRSRRRQAFRFGPETKAIELMNALRDQALADQHAHNVKPVVDSKLIGLASHAALTAPEHRT